MVAGVRLNSIAFVFLPLHTVFNELNPVSVVRPNNENDYWLLTSSSARTDQKITLQNINQLFGTHCLNAHPPRRPYTKGRASRMRRWAGSTASSWTRYGAGALKRRDVQEMRSQ
jgi:hypothetical protein